MARREGDVFGGDVPGGVPEDARREVREADLKYRNLFRLSNDAIFVLDGESGAIVEANRKVREHFGYDSDDLAAMTFRDLHVSGELERAEEAFREVVETGSTRFECLFRTRDGDEVPVEISANRLQMEGRTLVQAVVRDVADRKAAEERLRASESRLRLITEQMPALLWTVDRNLRFTSSTGAGLRALGLEAGEVVGETLFEFFDTDDPTFLPIAMHRRALEGGAPTFTQEWAGRAYQVHVEPLRDGEGDVEGVVGVAFDVTERKEAEKALRQSERRYRRLFEDSRDAIYLTDREGRIHHANRAALDLFGYEPDELDGLRVADLVVDEADLDRLLAELERKGGVQDYEMPLATRDGTVLQCELTTTVRRSPDGEVTGYQGIVRDVTEKRAFQRQLERRALHDQLTDLPNRALFWDRLSHAMARSLRDGEQQVAVCFIDLDRFKVVNDSLGHSAGDRVLERIGRRIRGSFREEDTVARFGGDEFTVLLEDVEGTDDPMEAAERLLRSLDTPLRVAGESLRLSASVGIALASDLEEPRPDDLVRNADVAMYRAKEKGGDRVHVFDPEVDRTETRRLQQENELREAVERGDFTLHYQPILDLVDRRIRAVEPLARWAHPEEGLLPPAEFIPLAEDSGLIIPLGERLLRMACRQATAWDEGDPPAGSDPLAVQVNLSARQFEDPGLLDVVEAVLEETGLEARRLQLEVTERVVMQGTERVEELKALGVRVAVDDFGTGYSSLSYLKNLSVDALKIDKSFVQGLGVDPRDEAIVRTIVTLADTLDLEVTAEGIEEKAQLEQLREMGCRLGQGFLFARPLPAEEFRGRFLS